ncbi:MAG: hypothetical protein V3T17_09890 [Pseudomonadales bacterium]
MCRVLCLVFITSISLAVSAQVVDQRNPNYQKGVQHIANAARALEVFKAELAKGEAYYAFPGLDAVRAIAVTDPVMDTLNMIIAPEHRRFKTQVLEPDGVFFNPVRVKANHE